MNMFARPHRLLFGLALAVALVACGSSNTGHVAKAPPTTSSAQAAIAADAKPLDAPVALRLGYLPTLNWAPVFVAQAKDYFKAEKLTVELVSTNGADAQSLIATGKLDGGFVGLSAGFFNGIANGLDVSIVGGGGESAPGQPLTAFVARKSGTVKTVQDLRGKKIAVPGGVGALSGWYLGQLLKQGGLTPADVQAVPLGLAEGLAALANGAVDAAVSSAPLLTQQLADGAHLVVGDMDAVLKPGSGGVILFGPNLVKDNRRAGAALLRALYRASRSDLQGDYRTSDATSQLLSAATKIPADIIKTTPLQTFDPNLGFQAALIDGMQQFWRAQGLLSYPTNFDAARLIDKNMVASARTS